MIKNKIRRAKINIIGRNRNGGFTMVEALVTLSIIIILLAIGMVAVIRYRDHLRITEFDNMARSIYMAAQNRVVLLDNDRRFQTLVEKGTLQADGVTFDGGGTKIEVTLTDSGTKNRWYIDSKVAAASVLDDLLPAGTIDPALRNGRFYIIYEPDKASVTDVFYVEDPNYDLDDAFAPSGAAEGAGIVSALEKLGAEDKKDDRMKNKPVMVGWFGSNAAAPRDKKLRLPDPVVEVLIVNHNELTLQVKYKMPSALPAGVRMEDVTRIPSVELSYKDASGNKKTVNLLEGTAAGRLTINGDITDGNITEGTYTWVLDSLDGPKRFKDLGIVSNLGGEFSVRAGLELTAPGCVGSSRFTLPVSDNSLFAKETANGSIAYIKNLRHLQNLDKDSGVRADITAAEQMNDFDAGYLRNNKDLDDPGVDSRIYPDTFYEFVPIENEALLCYRDKRTGEEADGKVDVPYFIKNLHVTTTSAATRNGAGLFGKVAGTSEDNVFQFQNVRLVNAKVTGGGGAGALAGIAENISFENCHVSDIDVMSTTGGAGGMVGVDAGTGSATISFEDCGAERIKVESGYESVGGLLGRKNSGSATFTRCTVGQAEGGAVSIISNAENAGGLMGNAESGATATFTDCAVGRADSAGDNAAVISAANAAGGMAGNVDGTCSFTGCQIVNAKVQGIDSESKAGGLAGSTKGVTFESYTAADGTVKNCMVNNVTVTAKGIAGGMAGNVSAENAVFKGCHVVNANVSGTDAGSTAGGMVGDANKAKFESDTAADGTVRKKCIVENVTVTAKKHTGGMAGVITDGGFHYCEVVSVGVSDTGEGKRPNNADGTENLVPDSNAGGMAGDAGSAEFDNCVVREITVTANGLAGGLAGTAGSSYSNCQVSDTVIEGKGERSYAGGLAGDTGATKFTGCTVGESGGRRITVTAKLYSGGLAGNVWAENTVFKGCHVVNANVSGTDAGSTAGGMVGDANEAKFEPDTAADGTVRKKCIVENVTVTAKKHTGGMAGITVSGVFTECEVANIVVSDTGEGAVTDSSAGGLAGSAGNTKFTDCIVGERGEITVSAYGLAGGMTGSAGSSFSGCQVFNATVEGKMPGSYAGGLAGDTGAREFINCTVGESGGERITVIADLYAGGLTGMSWGGAAFSGCQVVDTTVESTASPDKDKLPYAGGLTGASGGDEVRFSECTVKGSIVTGLFCAGGMAGHNYGSAVEFDNCGIKRSTVTANGTSAGGLLAYKGSASGTENVKNVKFTNCTVGKLPEDKDTKAEDVVTITAQSRAGGLLGYVDNSGHAIFAGCQAANATVKAEGGWDASAGGLAGKTGKGTQFANCTAGGERENENISVTASMYAGGLSGASVDSSFSNCQAVNATVTAMAWNGRAGGLVGRLVNYVNTVKNDDPTRISSCKVYWAHSKIQAEGSEGMAGGLVGEIATAKATIQNSFAAAFVYGGGYVGGLIGYLPGQATEDQWGNSSAVDGAPSVNVEKSYADCYIMLKGGTGWYAAGGLVGSNVKAELTLKDVYAAGFIMINEAADKGNFSGDYAAGLCGGDANLKVENAYAAMHYDQGDRIPYIFPLAKKATPVNSFYLYNSKYVVTAAGGYYVEQPDGTPYGQMANLNLGAAFVKPPSESHPYNIDGKGRSTYPFPGLTGLPHYGDWVTQDMANAISALNEEPETVSGGDVRLKMPTVSGGDAPVGMENSEVNKPPEGTENSEADKASDGTENPGTEGQETGGAEDRGKPSDVNEPPEGVVPSDNKITGDVPEEAENPETGKPQEETEGQGTGGGGDAS